MAARPIIAGAGVAGLWTAWRLAVENRPSILVTKGGLWDSATAWAQGGIAVALGPGDSPMQHAADTLAAGAGMSDPEAVRILTNEGPDRIRELVALGARFDRGPDGRLRFDLEAAHTRPRVIHAGGDRTGAALIGWLTDIVRADPLIEIHQWMEVRALIQENTRVTGILADTSIGRLRVTGPAVVLATGGVGQLYEITTNPTVATGDGWALAHQAGAELRDIEFLQFHPTALKLPHVNPAPLITEAVRGAGAILVDRHGRRFAFDADPRGELAPRDVVARAVATADSTGGAWLDAREIEDFPARFPGVTQILAQYGLNPAVDLLPVAPALHYAMGGIRTDLEGRTTRAGLWAAGEVACTGVHGANRLASNSLLEGLVFADRVARALIAESVEPLASSPEFEEVELLPEERTADAECEPIRRAMRHTMTTNVALQRTESSLAQAERTLAHLAREAPRGAWRTANQLLVAGLITNAARRRRESLGGHRRLDYPPLVPTPEPA